MKCNDFAHTFPFCLNVYMFDKKKNCFARQNWYLDDTTYCSKQWNLHSLKKYLLWKSQFVVFLAGVVTFDVCQHKSFAHVQKPYKLIFGVILIWWISLRKILLPFSKYLVYCFLCILVFKKLLLSFIIRVIFILLQWARNLSSPMKIPH